MLNIEPNTYSDFAIVSKDAEVNHCYGLEAFVITKSDIDALMCGKKLYTMINGDEYAITIEMEEMKNDITGIL